MKAIVHTPDPILTAAAKSVSSFDKKLDQLIGNMRETLLATRNPIGVGLAAPQIGEPYRIFLTRPREKSKIKVFVNPQIVEHSKDLTDGVPDRENKLEGCLSIPKVWGRVKRSKTITLAYQDEQGKKHRESFAGFLATIIQHETDHINGILFTQRVLEQKGKLFQTIKDEEGKEALEEISL